MTNMNDKKSFAIYDNSFNFYNPECDIQINLFHDELGNPIRNFQIRNSKDINIGFQFKNALFRENDFAEEENILIEFISIDYGNDEKLLCFFRKNGFLFKTSYDRYTVYSLEDFYLTSQRLKHTVELIMELQKEELDILTILKNVLYFLFTKPINITANGVETGIFSTFNNGVVDYLTTNGFLQSYPSEARYFPKQYEDFIPSEEILYFHSFDFDSFHDPECGNDYPDNISDELALISWVAPFIYQINKTKGVIFTDYNKEKMDDFCKGYEHLILSVAQNIIKNEIDYGVRRITPSYDSNQLIGGWNFPDLISALYFSIFFLNPNFTIVKKCENPTCSNYYTILNTDKRKKYCGTRCANAVSQRRARARKEVNEHKKEKS
jgi:hypothetical protein